MSLTVLSVAYPFAPVTADPAGGSEQVLAVVDRALTRAGHRSIVVAAQGSSVSGELRAVDAPDGPIEGEVWERAHRQVRAHIAQAIERDTLSVIHLHGVDFGAYLPPPGPPTLVTLHLPLAWYSPAWLCPTRPGTFLQPVSTSQARLAPAGATLIDPVTNGVDLDDYHPGAKRDFALVLGRVAPEKGFHDAIDAAKAADMPLIAAGALFPYRTHERYFAEEVVPRLDARRRWIGLAQGNIKRRLLREATCVLIPSTAPETSSLVAMEALASGTPVIAYNSGALPEIVEDGVTGFIVDSVPGLTAAMRRIGTIAPTACRRAACERFPLSRTVTAYLDLYGRLAA